MTILAPRHPERGEVIADMLQAQGLTVARRSLGHLPANGTDVYIADTIGELGTLYALAPIAFIGGSLVERGGQNPDRSHPSRRGRVDGSALVEFRGCLRHARWNAVGPT